MAQWVTCLPCTFESLSSNHPQANVVAPVYNLSVPTVGWEAEVEFPGVCGQLGGTRNYKQHRGPGSKQGGRQWLVSRLSFDLHMCVLEHVFLQPHTRLCIYTASTRFKKREENFSFVILSERFFSDV